MYKNRTKNALCQPGGGLYAIRNEIGGLIYNNPNIRVISIWARHCRVLYQCSRIKSIWLLYGEK